MRKAGYKILCFICFFLTFAQSIHSQSLANYSSARNTGISYASINLTGNAFNSWRNGTLAAFDDSRSDFTNIGFDFWYNGTRYSQFCVSTNGFIDFSSSTDDGDGLADDFGYDNTAFTNALIANSTNPAIAAFYDDLAVPGNGTLSIGNNIKYSLSGSAPSRTLTIEWINMQVYLNATPNLNFQVQLVESTGQIKINYGTMTNGTQLFSYCTGLNGAVISGAPTVAQLKELQAANGSAFSNVVQNNLATVPVTNSQYVFTPVVPTAAAGLLTFSSVNQTGMTLNWSNWASNEIGYVIYNSTDGINYSFVTQTAANAVNTVVTGLLPSTTYFWRLYAVTEGCLSAAISGTQVTNAAGSKLSTSSGNWGSASTWSPSGVPTAADNVIIGNGHSIDMNTNGTCNSLTIGQGLSGIAAFSNGGVTRSLTINGDLTINSSAIFSVQTNSNKTHTIVVKGNIINNGTLNLASDFNSFCNVVFSKNASQSISGNGAVTNFKSIELNMGSSIDNVLDVTSLNFSADSNFLGLTNGTFKLSTANAVNVIPFTGTTTIPSTAGLFLNSATAKVNARKSVTLSGKITVANGTLNIGNAVNLDLLAKGGTVALTGGILNIAGKYLSGVNNLSYYSQTSGTLLVPAFGSTNTTVAPFHVNSQGSQFLMSGGVIIIPREGGTGAQDLGFINTSSAAGSVTGGTLQIGNASTPAGQTISVNSNVSIGNLLVSSANATAKLNTNSLNVINNISITSGVLHSNNLNFTLGGSWINSGGTFTPGIGIVTFSSTAAQSLFKAGGEIFNHLNFIGSGVKTFSSPVTTNGNFSITAGSNADVSTLNHLLTVKSNFVNNGSFNARSGQVFLNGTIAQTVGGSSVTNFFDLALFNAAGATVINSENLIGSLTLSGGIFNSNGMLTMVSTATATARVAQITGTGDITGNVIVQRFAPGGTTGWALWGTPISSPLTLQDWDDDIFISCGTCPDGSAGGFLSIYTYDETKPGLFDDVSSYLPLTNITDAMEANKGYWVYLGDGQYTTNDITVDLVGTVRKFNNVIPLDYTNLGSPIDDGWNLIQNPYPSPISWSALKAATTNIDNAIYVYNPDLNAGTGGFASCVNGVSSPAIGAGGVGDAIPMSQAFYVHSTGATVLNAQESNKLSGNPTYLRGNNMAAPSLLRITLDGVYSFSDETVLYFQNGASNNFDDGFDSYKLRGQNIYAPFIALENGSELFQINGIAPISGNFTMPLKVITSYPGTYSISANNISSFPAGACISLYDKFTQITTDLKTNNYSFYLSDTTTVARFNLNITINQLNVSSAVSQPNCQVINQGQIIASGTNAGPWNYYWKLNGGAVKTSLNKNGSDSLSGLASGNYELEMNTVGMCDNNKSSFIIDQKIAPIAQFVCVDSFDLDQVYSMPFYNASSNAVNYMWNFGDNAGTSTDVSPVYKYVSPGTYTVNLISTSSTGCYDTTSKVVKITGVPDGIAVNNISGEGLIVRTMGNNEFILAQQFNEVRTLNFKLFDASGKLVNDYGNVSSNALELTVDLKSASAGIYFMKIIPVITENGSENYRMKVVKLPVK